MPYIWSVKKDNVNLIYSSKLVKRDISEMLLYCTLFYHSLGKLYVKMDKLLTLELKLTEVCEQVPKFSGELIQKCMWTFKSLPKDMNRISWRVYTWYVSTQKDIQYYHPLRKWNLKPQMRYSYIPIKMAGKRKSDNTKCWWRCRETGSFMH